MAHPIPAPRADSWAADHGHLVSALIRTAWAHGYNAVPRDGGGYPAVLIHPRHGLWSSWRGRLYLAPNGPGGQPWWHWSDTGRPLQAGPGDEYALVAEVEEGLTGAGPR